MLKVIDPALALFVRSTRLNVFAAGVIWTHKLSSSSLNILESASNALQDRTLLDTSRMDSRKFVFASTLLPGVGVRSFALGSESWPARRVARSVTETCLEMSSLMADENLLV